MHMRRLVSSTAAVVVLAGFVTGIVSPARANAATPGAPARPPATRPLIPYPVPDLPLPGYLQPVVDPTFGTTVTRVSDHGAMHIDPAKQQHLRNAYAKRQTWNSDGSLVVLDMTTPMPLLDGHTYRFLRTVDAPIEAIWANMDPTTMYGVRHFTGGHKLVAFNVMTGADTVLLDLSRYVKVSLGDGEGNLSDDDQWMVLHGTLADGTHDAVLYNRVTKATVVRNFGAHSPNWIGMSHSGRYVLVNWDTNGLSQYSGVGAFNLQLNFVRSIERNNSHGDLAYDTTGREVYVAGNDCTVDAPGPGTRCTTPAKFSAFPLDGTRAFPVITASTGYCQSGEHVSGRALKRPGWVVISDYGSTACPATYAGQDLIFGVKVDPTTAGATPVVQPFTQAHKSPSIRDLSALSYRVCPMAVVDPTGTKVMFGTDWDRGRTAPVWAYVAEQNATDPIVAKFDALRRPATFGTPIDWPVEVADGRFQRYGSAGIYSSATAGTHWLSYGLFAAYLSSGGPAGVLGFPTSDNTMTPDGGRRATFQHGTLTWAPDGSVTLAAPVRQRYMALGAPASFGGVAEPEYLIGPGAVQRFTGAGMY